MLESWVLGKASSMCLGLGSIGNLRCATDLSIDTPFWGGG